MNRFNKVFYKTVFVAFVCVLIAFGTLGGFGLTANAVEGAAFLDNQIEQASENFVQLDDFSALSDGVLKAERINNSDIQFLHLDTIQSMAVVGNSLFVLDINGIYQIDLTGGQTSAVLVCDKGARAIGDGGGD